MNEIAIIKPKLPATAKFYEFGQNNTGGPFDVDDQVCHFVIIEALSANDANRRAEDIGIYFDGCDDGRDCVCCGDRWSRAWSNDGDDEPKIYGKPPEQYNDMWCAEGEVYCRVYYMDGMIKEYRKGTNILSITG